MFGGWCNFNCHARHGEMKSVVKPRLGFSDLVGIELQRGTLCLLHHVSHYINNPSSLVFSSFSFFPLLHFFPHISFSVIFLPLLGFRCCQRRPSIYTLPLLHSIVVPTPFVD